MSMSIPSPPRASYLAAASSLVLPVWQVLFESAPLFMLWIGVGLSVAVFLVLWLRVIWLQYGKTVVMRPWQVPVLWITVAVAAYMMLFFSFRA